MLIKPPAAVRSLRIPAEEAEAIIRRLHFAAQHVSAKNKERRSNARYPFHGVNVSATFTHPGGSAATFLIDTHSLSAGGIGFLHGGYLHSGTRCIFVLQAIDQSWHEVEGHVVRCHHVERTVYDTGAAFDKPMSVELFCAGAQNSKPRVLVVEDAPMIRQLASFFLKGLCAEVMAVGSIADATQAMSSRSFDLAFVDVQLPDGSGMDLVKQRRAAGDSTHLIAFTANSAESQNEEIMAAGFNLMLSKPFTKEQIVSVVQDFWADPVLSTMNENEEMRPMLQAFLRQVPVMLEQMTQALTGRNRDALLTRVRDVKASAGSCGFSSICESAELLESALRDGQSVDEAARSTTDLMSLCRRAQCAG